MPESKKKQHTFEAQVDTQLDGLHLVRSQRPAAPKAGQARKPRSGSDAAETSSETQSPEPALVSKLIDFIKSI